MKGARDPRGPPPFLLCANPDELPATTEIASQPIHGGSLEELLLGVLLNMRIVI